MRLHHLCKEHASKGYETAYLDVDALGENSKACNTSAHM